MATAKASTNNQSLRVVQSNNIRSLSPENSNSIGCVIAHNTSIEGLMKTEENIRLDGHLSGSLSCQRRLVVGNEGSVEGSVWAKEADISGKIEGDITIDGLLILRANAKIGGDLKAKAIQIEAGATYDGECTIG